MSTPVRVDCEVPTLTPNGSYIIGSRRYVLVYPEPQLAGEPWPGGVFVPCEVPLAERKAWAAGFIAGGRKRVHDVDLPRTCDDPLGNDTQPNLVKPKSMDDS
jgi:hypothetical protein